MVLIINGPVKPVVFKSGLYDKEEDIVTMSHLTEYAKIVRIKTGNLSGLAKTRMIGSRMVY